MYNANNQLVASQDGNLRDAGKWLYYKYDDRGRMIEQGRYTAAYASQSAAQAGWNGNLPESAPDAIYTFDSYTGVPAALAESGIAKDTRVFGLKTYEKLRNLNAPAGSPEFTERAFYYDAKGRVVQQVSTNIKAGTDRTTFTYNWGGDVLTSNESHTYNGTTSTLVTTATYDRTGKKQRQEVTADGQTAAKAVNIYEYDDLNRLKTKKYGDLAETTSYNLQGWLAGVASDKFTQSLAYSYNGNINSVNWTQSGKPAAAYNLAYDAQNRLAAATGNAFEEKGISYDRNGNILSLQRTANNAAKDNITYNYSGNQLTSVAGNLASAYTYDNNGNLKTDSRKSFEFSYNYLNLLQSVGETSYTYAADGTKLSVKNGANGFDYLGSLILSANNTEFQFSDGIITKTTGGYDVTYHLRDHLGSVRSVVNKNGDILQQSDYYPFGLKQERADYVNSSNRFLYNGKELQTTGNLGVLDYGARMYDAVIGRWFVKDAMAEKNMHHSPYVFSANNPIRFVDPDGNDWWDVVVGTAVALLDNATGIDVRDSYTPTDAADYNSGQDAGDVSSIMIGMDAINTGGGVAAGSLAVTAGTAGASVAVSGTTFVAGTAIAAHGVFMSANGAGNLASRKGRVAEDDNTKKSNVSSGNKNSPHANQKAKQSAAEKYQDAKQRFEELSSKRGKTQEDNKLLDKYKKEQDHYKRKMNEKGENHSRNAKGNR